MSPRKVPLPLRIEPDLLARVDAARGDVSRTRWVERALEKALTVCSCGASGFGDERARRHGPECMYAMEGRPALSDDEPVAEVLGAKVRKSRKTPSLKDTWGR